MRLSSTRYGSFDPLHPDPLPGPFARIVRVPAVDIAAPPETVWTVLVDWERYGDWCPFTRRIVTDGKPDSPVDLHLNWSDGLAEPTQRQREAITVLETGRAIGWGLQWPAGLLRAERVQYLEPSPAGTRYHTWDRFSGVLVPLVFALYGRKMEAGFARVGRALAERVEQLQTAAATARPID